jgi:hypothetical protein
LGVEGGFFDVQLGQYGLVLSRCVTIVVRFLAPPHREARSDPWIAALLSLRGAQREYASPERHRNRARFDGISIHSGEPAAAVKRCIEVTLTPRTVLSGKEGI